MKRQAGFGSAVKALFSREHETIQALCDVSFTVGDGEIVGYIGPNGAGKSTTVKIMCGILTPDSGRCPSTGASVAGAHRPHAGNRRRVRPAQPALVGCAGHRQF